MPSTYSSNLKIELIATGEQDTTWGSTTNTNLGTALEESITGTGTVTFASADVTLGFASSNASQTFRNIRLVLTGTTGGARNLIVPNIEKLYFIDNTTANIVTVKTSAGTGIAVPSGAKSIVYADGVNVVEALSHFNSLTANSPAFTGVPTAPTALAGTNNTQIATTAFATSAINTAIGGLGTMSTQNANSVAITGGSITGITDLAVADGGTGASDAGTARTNLGLGSIATQAANNVAITGGSITGITDLAVADGGTGASTAAGAATNFAAAFGNLLYPVGSIYINATNNTNPGTLLGFGTWVAFGAGRVPVGFDSGDPLFDTAEETGGSKDATVVSHTHTFSATTSQNGLHFHNYPKGGGSDGPREAVAIDENINSSYTQSTNLTPDRGTDEKGDHAHTVSGTTASTGSSGTNANLQPYITVYMWKRTA